MTIFRRARDRAVALWRLLRDERSSPREVAAAVAVGAFAGCTPAVGFHGGLAVTLASFLRLSRIWAFVGSRVSNVVLLSWIVFAEIETSHRLRIGAWIALSTADVLAHAGGLLLDWCLGSVVVGAAIASICGVLAYGLARWRGGRAARSRAADP